MNVMAAPNRSAILARVEGTDGPQRFGDPPKWFLAVWIREATPIEGGLFVRAGDSARVFTTEGDPGLRPGDEFRAEVEFVGGHAGESLRLIQLYEANTDHAGSAATTPGEEPPGS